MTTARDDSHSRRGRARLAECDPPPALSVWLDQLARLFADPFGCEAPAYLVFGVAGIAAAFALFVGLCLRRGVPIAVAIVVSTTAIAVFVIAGVFRKALVGRDQHVLLEDVLLVLAATAVVVWALGLRPLVLADLLVPALGVFLVFGRLGCFVSGCCHGRPSLIGVRYDNGAHDHDPLSGVRLFPLPLVEAAWLVIVSAIGVALALSDSPEGSALSLWLLAYAAGRFVLEFVRGDSDRPRLGALSEAQWIALFLVAARVVFEQARGPRVDVVTLVALGGTLTVVVLAYVTRARWLALPAPMLAVDDVRAHQRCLIDLEKTARRGAGEQGSARATLCGAALTLVIDRADHGEMHAFTLREPDALHPELAARLAGLILQRLPEHRVVRADYCELGSYHLWVLVNPRGPHGSAPDDDPRLVLMRARAAAHEALHVVLQQPAPPARDGELLPPPAQEPPRSPSYVFGAVPVFPVSEHPAATRDIGPTPVSRAKAERR